MTRQVSGTKRARARARGATVGDTAKVKKPVGRPTIRSPEMAVRICTLIAQGRSLRATCTTAGMPSLSTVMAWLAEDKGFAQQYERAREARAEVLVEEMLEIADTPELGVKTVSKGGKVETTTGDMIDHRRLQVEVRKWHASKMLPRRYGDKLEMSVTTDFAQRLIKARERAFAARKDAPVRRKP